MNDRIHEKVVEEQFGPRAKAYVESLVHSQGADLEAVEAMVRDIAPKHALDLGTGGGHLAYCMARHSRKVTALDLSREMLSAVAATAKERGLGNIETAEAPAERIPFDNESFDFLASRFSAHHWRDFSGGLREARRVLERGAHAVFIDVYASGTALFDTHLQTVELLRDTSHVRDYTASEWIGGLGQAGFALQNCRTRRLRMDFPVWIARMRTPDLNAQAIRSLQIAAAADTKAYFEIEADGSFLIDVLMAETTAG